MRLFNRKKIFGLFNLLDLVIILLVLAVILPFVGYYIKFNQKGMAEQAMLEKYMNEKDRETKGYKTLRSGSIEVIASLKNLKLSDIEKIKVGDKEILPDGTISAEILWLGKPEKNYMMNSFLASNDNECIKIVPDGDLYSLKARMRLRGYLGNDMVFRYKGRNLENLQFLTFTTKDYSYDFMLEMYPYEYLNAVTMDLFVCFKNLTVDDLKDLKPGVKELAPGVGVVAEILWIGKPEPNYYYMRSLVLNERNYVKAYSVDKNLLSLPAKVRLWGTAGSKGNAMFKYKNSWIENSCMTDFILDNKSYQFVVEMYPVKVAEDYGATDNTYGGK